MTIKLSRPMLLRVLASTGIVLVSLCLNPGFARAETSIDDMREKLNILERDILDVRKLAQKNAQASKAKAAASKDAKAGDLYGSEISGDVVEDFEVRISHMQDQVRELIGQCEQANYKVEQISKGFERLSSDIEVRMTELETKSRNLDYKLTTQNSTDMNETTAAGAAANKNPVAAQMPKTEASKQQKALDAKRGIDGKAVEAKMSKPLSTKGIAVESLPAPKIPGAVPTASVPTASVPTPTAGAEQAAAKPAAKSLDSVPEVVSNFDEPAAAPAVKTPAVIAVTEGVAGVEASLDPGDELTSGTPRDQAISDEYDVAFAKLRDGKYDEAEKLFKTFLKQYKDHRFAPNAQYWLGESYYARSMYKEAAVTFATGFQNYNTHSKAMDSMMKLGLSLSALGKKDDACVTLKQFPVKYPSAPKPMLKRVSDEVQKLGCK